MTIVKDVNSFQDIKVQIVKSFPDLYVYVTKNKFEAKNSDFIWFFDKDFEDTKIKFVNAFPDLKIQYVDSKNKAGWKNKNHKLTNRIK